MSEETDDDRRVLTGGEAIVEMLTRFGVELMFGLPGDHTHLYDALHRQDRIRHVLVRHEQAAAHMADAHARATGRVGVCDASVGPGATNLLTGIAEAFTSGIPVVAIVSDVRSDWRGRDSFQEVDQVAVFAPVTKEVHSIDHVERIPELVGRAFRTATTGRPGPVLLSVPIDVLRAEHPFGPDDLRVDERYGRFPANRIAPAPADVAAAVDALLAADRPIILAGGGVIASGASAEIQNLAERLDIPVATTFMGKGSLPERHPLALGPFGLIGRPVTNEQVLSADLALAVGTRFTNVDTAAWRIPRRSTTLIQVDIEPTQIGRNYHVDRAVPGDARTVLRAILDELAARGSVDRDPARSREVADVTARWRAEHGVDSPTATGGGEPVHPLQVIRALQTVMGPDDVLICDSGFNQIWGGQYFEVGRGGRSYLGPRGSGAMGFSVPAAIAHGLTEPDRRVVALCGDGGFAMVVQELETARRTGARPVIVVMNNANLQYIQANQKLLFDGRTISTDFTDLDHGAIARAFGCHGVRVERSRDLGPALERAFAADRAAVVDVRILGDAVPDRMSLQALPD